MAKKRRKTLKEIEEINPAVKRHLELELEIKSLQILAELDIQVTVSYTHNYY
jgi:hypothetical protein